jgi:hypothetical protein
MVLPDKVRVTPHVDASGAVSWTVAGPVGFAGVAFCLEGTRENRRVDEALTGRVTRAGSRVEGSCPRGDPRGYVSLSRHSPAPLCPGCTASTLEPAGSAPSTAHSVKMARRAPDDPSS